MRLLERPRPKPIDAQTSHSLQSDPLTSRSIFEKEKDLFRPFCYAPTLPFAAVMPIGKISQTSGKAPDYSSGSTNIQHATQQSGGKAEAGYQKSTAAHSYGAGALNEEAKLQTPKVKENLGYSKSELAGQSSYGAGAVGVEQAVNAPKIKHEGLGQVDKKQEMVHQGSKDE